MLSTFSDHMEWLESATKEESGKVKNMLKLYYTFPDSQQIKKQMKRKITKYFKVNENEIAVYKNYAVKMLLIGMCEFTFLC